MNKSPQAKRPLTPQVVQWFVDREKVLQQFAATLDHDMAALLTVEGDTGIGKTWFLERIMQEAESHSQSAANLDLRWAGSVDDAWMVDRLAHSLGQEHFPTLNERIERGVKAEVIVRIKGGGGGNVSIEGSQVNAPVAGGSIFQGNTFNLQTTDKKLYKNWLSLLNECFFTDLTRLGESRGAVLLFDEVEHICSQSSLAAVSQEPSAAQSAKSFSQEIGSPKPAVAYLWLENLLWRMSNGLLNGVKIVLAGQKMPPFPSAWQGVAIALKLEDLPAAEVRKYLKLKASQGQVISEKTVNSVYRWTKGRPDLVAALADRTNLDIPLGKETDPGLLLEILVQAILDERKKLENQDEREPRLRDALRAAAVPEWFDAGVLAALGIPEHEARLSDLSNYSFVQPAPMDGWVLRDEARRVLLASWSNAKPRLAELQRCAAAYFDERAKRAENLSIEQWEMKIEAIGNQLAVDETSGCEQMRQLCITWEAHYRVTAYGALLARADRVPGLSPTTIAWLAYLKGRLALLQEQATRAADDFRMVRDQVDPSSELYVLASQSLGEALAAQGDWSAAVAQYLQALEYYKGNHDKVSLGQVQLLLGTAYLDEARSLGPPFEPRLERASGLVAWLRQVPAILISLPFMLYAWLIRRWRFLPPLQQTLDYRNWTLMYLLLSSVYWTREAETTFEAAKLSEAKPLAWRRLGQAYHLLGWWNEAEVHFEKVRESTLAAANRYWKAQVLVEQAEAQHAAGDLVQARMNLEESVQVFHRFEDEMSESEARTLLGQVYLEDGEAAPGLELLVSNLPKLSPGGNRLAAGLALHRLRSWLRRGIGSSSERAAVRKLVDSIQDQVFLVRVPDRTATALETVVGGALGLVLVTGVVALAASFGANLTSAGSFIAGLLSATNILRMLGWSAIMAWCLLVGIALVGLCLVTWSTRRHAQSGGRREFGIAMAEGVSVDPDHLALVDRHGQAVREQSMTWHAIEAYVTIERVLWRMPLALASGLRLFGQGQELQVPATVLWYEALKTEIDDNLEISGAQPARWRLDLHVLRSRTGLAFFLGVLLFLAGSALIYRWRKLPVSVDLAAALGPLLMYLAVIGLIIGSYWWLILHPLWVRYHLQPRSVAPFVAILAGAVLVAVAFYLHLYVPYFGILSTLNRFFFPLGFVLILLMPLWILVARQWKLPLTVRGDPAYPLAWRVVAALSFVGALTLTGIYAEREWYYDATHNYQAITYFYYEDYLTTVDLFSQQIDEDRNLANAYYYRGRAYLELEQPAQALADFQQIIQSGQAAAAHYWLSAEARFALEDYNGACADLAVALTTGQWPLSTQEKARADEEFTKLCANNQ